MEKLLGSLALLLVNSGYGRPEWTVEANPGDLTPEWLGMLQGHGVNRLSIGVQSFDERVRDRLGRRGSLASVLKGLDIAGGFWKGSTSIDLIHSVPGQGLDSVERDLEEISKRSLNHVSWYGLSVEEGTPLHARGLREEEHPEHQDTINQRLSEMGLKRYEISNFARKGYESLHNSRYWQLEPWLGIGPGAVSMMPGSNGLPERFTDRPDLREFVSKPDSVIGHETVSPVELFKEYFMMGLRTRKGTDIGTMERVFSFNPLNLLGDFMNRYRRHLVFDGRYLSLTPGGLDISNSLLVDLFIEAERFPFPARNVVWPIFSLD
jgi:oxygen-independent coproporphyrinogen-3 oxidase